MFLIIELERVGEKSGAFIIGTEGIDFGIFSGERSNVVIINLRVTERLS